MAALVLALNQVKFCELHGCQPRVEWGPFPACKYAGVRFPGRTPFYDSSVGRNAFEYYFQPFCATQPPAQESPPALSCEQREQIHRTLPWAVRTYYYGAGLPTPRSGPPLNETFDERWYGSQRAEGHRLVSSYLRLQPKLASRFDSLHASLLGGKGGPVLGVHLRGTDKGRYIGTAGSGRQVSPREYEPYVRAYLAAHPNATVFVATDSPSFLREVLATWPAGRLVYRRDVLRREGNAAFTSSKAIGEPYRKGEEVLLDTLLLSRCDFLLHSASGVAEFAIYWNYKLHRRSVHLQYAHGRRTPPWMSETLRRAARAPPLL